jgi:(R,R)-butanediol dehydrogenase/meso-butanediol dehydrogenase/diacetyl reductase
MERAREAGADWVIDATQEQDPVKAMERATGRSPGVIFECVGRPLLQRLFQIAPHGSHLCILGACMEQENIRISSAAIKDLTLSIPIGYGREEFAFILDLLARGKIETRSLISDVVPLEQAPVLFEALRKPNDHCKVILSNEAYSNMK